MQHIIETRRAGGQRRVSDAVLCRNVSVDTASAPQLQVQFLARRFNVGDALGRAVAELAFGVRKEP